MRRSCVTSGSRSIVPSRRTNCSIAIGGGTTSGRRPWQSPRARFGPNRSSRRERRRPGQGRRPQPRGFPSLRPSPNQRRSCPYSAPAAVDWSGRHTCWSTVSVPTAGCRDGPYGGLSGQRRRQPRGPNSLRRHDDISRRDDLADRCHVPPLSERCPAGRRVRSLDRFAAAIPLTLSPMSNER